MGKVDTFYIIVKNQKFLLDLGHHRLIQRFEWLKEINTIHYSLDSGLCTYSSLWTFLKVSLKAGKLGKKIIPFINESCRKVIYFIKTPLRFSLNIQQPWRFLSCTLSKSVLQEKNDEQIDSVVRTVIEMKLQLWMMWNTSPPGSWVLIQTVPGFTTSASSLSHKKI